MKKNLSLLFVLLVSLKSISQEFKDLIVTNLNDSIHCTITLVNDYDIFYDHKVKKKITSDFIQISDLKCYTYNDVIVIPVVPVIDDYKLRIYHEQEKYENWLNFQHQKEEHFHEDGPVRPSGLIWEVFTDHDLDDRFTRMYSLDSSYFLNFDKLVFKENYGTNPFLSMKTKVQLVRRKDMMALTLPVTSGDGFAVTIIWKSNSTFDLCTYRKKSGGKPGWAPTMWKFDLEKDTFQVWESGRRFQDKEIETIKKRWRDQKMKYPWPLNSK